jgi:hypothetical protein
MLARFPSLVLSSAFLLACIGLVICSLLYCGFGLFLEYTPIAGVSLVVLLFKKTQSYRNTASPYCGLHGSIKRFELRQKLCEH